MNFKNKKIFIAGASGFLGGAVVEELRSAGYKKISAPDSGKFNLTKLADAIRATEGAELVVNAAGFVVSRVMQNELPADVLYKNSLINLQLLEACRANSIPAFVVFGSVTSYAEDMRRPFLEKDLFSGKVAAPESGNFYGISKWFNAVSAMAYAKQHKIKARVIVFPNIYGPGDKFNHSAPPLIPSLIKKIYDAKKAGQAVFRAGNNSDTEVSPLYIRDAAKMAKALANRFGKEEFLCVNAAPERSVKIRKICEIIADKLDFRGRIKWDAGKRTLKTQVKISSSLAKKRFGWRPLVGPEEGIGETVRWFLETYAQKK